MRVHAFTCGWLSSPLGLFLEGEHGRLRVPVPAFLIEHPRGRVLFDTGLHADVQRDPHARLGRLADAFVPDYHPGEDVAARVRARGADPERVDIVVLSHLHFDHAGGLAAIPNARVIVQRRDWDAGHDADLAASLSFFRQDFDYGHDVRLVEGEHDVFGDGRIVCLPTHGHTPGHQSLRLRLAGGDVVLTADACYLRRTMDTDHLPPLVFDRDATRDSLRRLRALRDGGARVVYGHDPDDWATAAPELA
jgi:glyoxylase-like metal-dependent hydrolase (beta-lactamase superfamily II)